MPRHLWVLIQSSIVTHDTWVSRLLRKCLTALMEISKRRQAILLTALIRHVPFRSSLQIAQMRDVRREDYWMRFCLLSEAIQFRAHKYVLSINTSFTMPLAYLCHATKPGLEQLSSNMPRRTSWNLLIVSFLWWVLRANKLTNIVTRALFTFSTVHLHA